jgi:hypothetical protein
MSNNEVIQDRCEHPDCGKFGARHLFGHNFCSRHRNRTVKEMKELPEPPEQPEEWIENNIADE